MKRTILSLLGLCFAVTVCAQQVEYPYAKQIEKGDWEKAEKKIIGDYQKDSSDVLNCYALYKLMSNADYPGHDDYKAYRSICRAYTLLQSADEKAKGKLLKKNANEETLKADVASATEKGFRIAESAGSIESYEDFLSTYAETASEQQVQTAKKERNALEFKSAKDANTIEAFQAFIDRRPDAEDASIAIQLRNNLAFSQASAANTIDAYQVFIDKYPDAAEVASARTNIHKLAYAQATAANTIGAYQGFINKYPDAVEVASARTNIHRLAYEQAISANTIDAYQSFIDKYPAATQVNEAKKRINKMAYDEACSANTEEALRDYIAGYPESEYIKEAKKKMESFNFFKSEITIPVKTSVYAEGYVLLPLGEFIFNAADNYASNNNASVSNEEDIDYVPYDPFESFFGSYYDEIAVISGTIICDVFLTFVSSDSTFIVKNIPPMTDPKLGIVSKTSSILSASNDMGYDDLIGISINIEKLIKFAKSKGVECDLLEHTFDLEMRKYNFFKKYLYFRVENAWDLLHDRFNKGFNLFDVTLAAKSPQPIDGTNNCSIKFQLEYRSNKNTFEFYQNLLHYLEAISIPEQMVKKYEELEYPMFKYQIVDYRDCYFADWEPYNGKLMIDDIQVTQGGTALVNTLSRRTLYFYNPLGYSPHVVYDEDDVVDHAVVVGYDNDSYSRKECDATINEFFSHPLLYGFEIKAEGYPKFRVTIDPHKFLEHFKRGFIDCCTPYGVWGKSKFGYVSNVRDGIIGLRMPEKTGEVLHQSDEFEIIIPQSKATKIKRMFADQSDPYGHCGSMMYPEPDEFEVRWNK